MANPIVKVILSAVDEVSANAKKAADGIQGFSSKVSSTMSTIRNVLVAGVFADFFKDSVQEAMQAEVGMQRLGVAVTNSGNDFGKLKPQLDATVKSVMKVSTATDDELNEALTHLVTISGDTQGSMKNLGLVTDLAAFKGIGLSEAADVVGKAMNGNTTAFNKLGIAGKDSTTVLENARTSMGGFAAKEAATVNGALKQLTNQWGELKEAVGKVILGGNDASGMLGGLAGALGKVATWVEQNEESFSPLFDALSAVGHAAFDIGKMFWDTFGPALQFVAKIVAGTLVGGLQVAAATFKTFAAVAQGAIGAVLQGLGWLGEKGGKLLKVFGVDVNTESSSALKAFGENLVTSAKKSADEAEKTFNTSIDKLMNRRKFTNLEIEKEEEKHGDKVGDIRKRANEKQLAELQKAHDDAVAYANKNLDAYTKTVDGQVKITTAALNQMLKGPIAGQGAAWQAIADDAKRLNEEVIATYNPAQRLADTAGQTAAHARDTREEMERERALYIQHVSEAGQLAVGLIDGAKAMGKLDDHAANALKTVVNMGTSIATMIGSGFTTGGLVGLIGGLASLIGGWANNPAEKKRMEVAMANIAALEKNTDIISLGATGRTIQGTGDALAIAIAKADSLKKPRDRAEGMVASQMIRDTLFQEFAKKGVGKSDALQLLKDLGIEGLDSNDWETFQNALHSAQKALEKIQPGFGNTFAGQLKAVQEGFGIFGVEDPDAKLRQFDALQKKFSTGALGQAFGAGSLETGEGRDAIKSALQRLFARMANNEKVDMGDLNGQQLLDFIKLVLPLLGGADGIVPAGFLPTLPNVGVSPSLVGSLPVPDSFGLGGGAGGEGRAFGGLTQNVTGDVQIGPINITTADGQTAEEIVDVLERRISESMGKRYIAQLTALGRSVAGISGVS